MTSGPDNLRSFIASNSTKNYFHSAHPTGWADKDNDNDNDKEKDKDAKNITETLILCYIFGILMTQAFQV